MFCPKCGQSLPEGSIFCPSCGFNLSQGFGYESPAPDAAASPLNKAKKFLSDPLFITIAILLTVAAGVKLLMFSIDIFLIPIVIGVWMVYAGNASESTRLMGSGITITSIAVKVQYIVIHVVCGLLITTGVILLVAFASMGAAAGSFTYETFEEAAAGMGITTIVEGGSSDALDAIFSLIGRFSGAVVGTFLFSVTLFVSGITILFNILFIRRFSKFITKAKRALIEEQPVELGDRRCATWLLVYGIISALGALSSFVQSANILVLATNGCVAAACILASVLMKKEAE